MVVDCHTHIRSASMQNLDASEHLAAADVVDKCIILASSLPSDVVGGGEQDSSSEQVNKHLSQYVTRYERKMIGFAFIDPLTDGVGVKNLKASTEKLGLKGLVLYCSQSAFHPAHTRAMRLYESAQDLHLPVFFHNTSVGQGGILEYAYPFLLDEVARTFPELKIIVGNMGFPFYEQTLCLVAKHKNVFADLSVKPGNVWQIYNVVASAYEQGVMDKLLFGSAFPAAKAEDCMEALFGFNKLLAGANLPVVPRSAIQSVIERETLKLLGIEK
ncbi:MAG: amidohydrolase family protein [Sedimentisphaerales bacterium]